MTTKKITKTEQQLMMALCAIAKKADEYASKGNGQGAKIRSMALEALAQVQK